MGESSIPYENIQKHFALTAAKPTVENEKNGTKERKREENSVRVVLPSPHSAVFNLNII